MFFIKNIFNFQKGLLETSGGGEDIKEEKKDLDFNKLQLDGRLSKQEIKEIKDKFVNLSKEKKETIIETKQKLKDFINLDYREANKAFLSLQGKSIKDLQIRLNKELGLNLKEDNIFGKNTFLAILEFQKRNGLDIDGIIGPDTYKNLFNQDKGQEKDSGGYKSETMLASGLDGFKDKKQIILRAIQAVEKGDNLSAKNCTDWVSKVWGKDVNDGGYVFKGKIIGGGDRGTGLIPKKYAPDNVISTIEPGDHILVDKPPYKSGKTHSIMALEKPKDGLVKVASFPGTGKPRIEWRDLDGLGRGDRTAHVARINRLS